MAGNKVKRKMQRSKGMLEESITNTPVDILQGSENVDEATTRQVESMAAGLTKLVHSKETREDVLKVLSSGDPTETVPAASQMIFSQIDNAKIPSEVRLSSFIILVTDLVELGNAAGTFNIEQTEDAMQPVLQASIQKYIEYGVKQGIIDPVELQQKVEPLMSDQQRAIGTHMAHKGGVPMEPTGGQAVLKMHQDTMKPLEEENQKLRGMLEQVNNVQVAPPQVQAQGGQV